MKKLMIFTVVVGGLAAFTACKKDRVCECSGNVIGITYTVDTTFTGMSKSDADAACTALSFDLSSFGSQTCELK